MQQPHRLGRRTANPAGAIVVAVAILLVSGILPAGARAFEAPAIPWQPRAYACPRLTTPPVIDGRVDEDAWSAAPWSEPFVDIQGPLAPEPRLRTRVRMGWNATHFYVAARLDEPHVWGTLVERDAVIYHDNDFEVFIDPDGDNHLYGELEINALGTVWDLLLARPYRDGGPAVDAWDIAGLRSAVAVDGTLNNPRDTDRGWCVELAIPWRVLGAIAGRACPPEIGDIWRVNFSRVEWRAEVADGAYRKVVDAATGRALPEDNWVWSPQGLIAMHCPEMWGEVMFTDGPPADAAREVAASPAHARLAMASGLMPLYYRQQARREADGAYAASLAGLDIPVGHWLLWPGESATTAALPAGWTLQMTGGADWFRATLATPLGTATIDHTGRLETKP